MALYSTRSAPQSHSKFTTSITIGWSGMYYSNSFSRAGLVVFLSIFLFLSVVSAAPLSVRDYRFTSSDADVSRHIIPRGILHHTSAPVQSSQLSRMKAAFKKLESGATHVEHAVAHFVNDNKDKIANFGLKVLSMVEQYGGKTLSAIPVIGKPLSKRHEIASKFTNNASNHIHADLGRNVGNAMEGIDEAEHIADYVRRQFVCTIIGFGGGSILAQ